LSAGDVVPCLSAGVCIVPWLECDVMRRCWLCLCDWQRRYTDAVFQEVHYVWLTEGACLLLLLCLRSVSEFSPSPKTGGRMLWLRCTYARYEPQRCMLTCVVGNGDATNFVPLTLLFQIICKWILRVKYVTGSSAELDPAERPSRVWSGWDPCLTNAAQKYSLVSFNVYLFPLNCSRRSVNQVGVICQWLEASVTSYSQNWLFYTYIYSGSCRYITKDHSNIT